MLLAFAVLCLGGHPARAQATGLPYWATGWSVGSNGNFAGLAGSDALGGDFASRYNFSNGLFVGSERGGLGVNGFGAFGSGSAFSYDGVQVGYNLKSAPVAVYAGFDTLRYNGGIGSPSAPFDTASSPAAGYGAHAGIEIRPASNLTLSLGMGFAQQSGGVDSNVIALTGATQSALGLRR